MLGQNFYGYNAAYSYPQYQQGGAGYGYGAYGQYALQGAQPQVDYQQQQLQQQPQQVLVGHQGHRSSYGHQQRLPQDQPLDFTQPDDTEVMNRRYASQRAYQVRLQVLLLDVMPCLYNWLAFKRLLVASCFRDYPRRLFPRVLVRHTLPWRLTLLTELQWQGRCRSD